MQQNARKIKSLKQPKLVAGFASRKVALDSLLAVEREHVFANVALAAAFKKSGLSERDRAFVTALVQGVTRHRLELDEKIDAVSQRPGSKIDVTVRNILRLGSFQLLYMANIPQQAVLNTSTELAKVCGHVGVGKFTNGLLRNLARQFAASAVSENLDSEPAQDSSTTSADLKESAQEPTAAANDSDQKLLAGKGKSPKQKKSKNKKATTMVDSTREKTLAEKYSMPDWLVDRWLSNFGQDETIKLLNYAQQPPVLSIRTCEMSITPEGLQEILERKGLACKRGQLVPTCLILERGRTTRDGSGDVVLDRTGDVKTDTASATRMLEGKSRKTATSFRGSPEKLTGYAEGMFSIQDEAAAFISVVVDAKPGEQVIDLCAAPGGKTVHIAEMMENRGRVIAVDQSASRLSPLKESRTRLGLKNIEIVAHDGRTFNSQMLVDRILIDAPCTGTGVINKRADLRFKRKPEDLASLVELQRELLRNATGLVKPGGILVYATCSIEPEENFGNAQWFLNNFEEFEPDDIGRYLPKQILEECAPTWEGPACKSKIEDSCLHMVQLLPSRHGVSGFFVAKFRKKDSG